MLLGRGTLCSLDAPCTVEMVPDASHPACCFRVCLSEIARPAATTGGMFCEVGVPANRSNASAPAAAYVLKKACLRA